MHPHHRRDLETRLSDASRKLLVAAPREELENERAKLEALQRAYRSAADQARAPPPTHPHAECSSSPSPLPAP